MFSRAKLAIIGGLLLIGLSLAFSIAWKANEFRRARLALAQTRALEAAITAFYDEFGRFPASDLSELTAFSAFNLPERFLDPWGRPYEAECTAIPITKDGEDTIAFSVRVWSCGRDGVLHSRDDVPPYKPPVEIRRKPWVSKPGRS